MVRGKNNAAQQQVQWSASLTQTYQMYSCLSWEEKQSKEDIKTFERIFSPVFINMQNIEGFSHEIRNGNRSFFMVF